jgi:ATP-dependent DNA helicase RecQ
VLRGEVPVEFRKETEALASGRRRASRGAAAAEAGALSAGDDALWQRLRSRRLELAREQGVPPYVIFHDATLMDMIRRRPRSLAELGEIPGVGRSKLERYGGIFLEVVAEQG